jgi:transcriptional regulator with XRE-family HTH domain
MSKNSTRNTQPFLRHLGDAIRDRRVDLYLSQEKLGLRAKLHRTYVTDIENGLRNISLLTLLRVTTALKSPVSSPILVAEKAMDKEDREKDDKK